MAKKLDKQKRPGTGGNETESRGEESAQNAGPGERQSADDGAHDDAAYDDVAYDDRAPDEFADVQQSSPREGMGHHRHSGRGNEQALDADDNVDDVGTHHGSAGRSRAEGPNQ